MYITDNLDMVVGLNSMPQPSASAPVPHVVSNESAVLLSYVVADVDHRFDGSSISLLGPGDTGQTIALVRFSRCRSYMFGAPNDEAIFGHPLWALGLRPYSVFEVKQSSWIRQLSDMNAVHPRHMPQVFADYKHFIFTFQDSTFECVAKVMELSVYKAKLNSVLIQMGKALDIGK